MAFAQLASKKKEIAKTQDFNKSISYFNQAIKMCPEKDDIYYNLGLAYSLMDDRNLQAAEDYTKVLEKNPNHQQALDRLISSYLILKEYNKAKNLLLAAVQKQPTKSEYFKNLGKIYLLEKDYNSARQAFLHANKLNPTDREVINFLNKMGIKN